MADDKNTLFHPTCFACGAENNYGLKIKFTHGPEGSIGHVSVPPHFQSYEGVVHGGIVATMLDSAMVHCLEGQYGKNPVTSRLEVRYLRSVSPGEMLTVKARMSGRRGRVVLADAELLCSGKCHARARGVFTFADK